MPIKPPVSVEVFKDPRLLGVWLDKTQVTPSNGSVDTGQIAGASAAADDKFYVKRSGAMAFDGLRLTDIPVGVATDLEVAAADAVVAAGASSALSAHVAAPDPHSQYLTATEGDAAYVLQSNVLNGSATYDPASLIDGAGVTTTVTVTGAALGDFALVSFSIDLQGILLTGYVSSANTVSVRFQNETTSTIDLGSGTLRARVWKQ